MDAGQKAVNDAIATAKSTKSVNAKPRTVRVSVLKAAMGPVIDNLTNCPAGHLGDVLAQFKAEFETFVSALEDK